MIARKMTGKEREPYDILLKEVEIVDLAVSELFSAAHSFEPQMKEEDLCAVMDNVLELLDRQLNHLGVTVIREYDEKMD